MKLAIVIAVILTLYFAIPIAWLPAQIAWSGLLVLMFPAGLWLLRFPTPGEWQAVRSVLRRIPFVTNTLSLRDA